MATFDLVFSGELIEGHDADGVRRNLQTLFRSDEAAIARLFSGKPVIIKKGLDEASAARYQAALRKAGARCELRSAANPPLQAPEPAGDLASATVLPPGSILPQPPVMAPPEFSFTGLSVAASGETLVDPPAAVTPQLPDLTGLEVAPVGEDLVTPAETMPAPLPDISGITLAPPGTAVLRPGEGARPSVPPPVPPSYTLAD